MLDRSVQRTSAVYGGVSDTGEILLCPSIKFEVNFPVCKSLRDLFESDVDYCGDVFLRESALFTQSE